MSQYTQFFIRSKTDEFLPIGIFSRSTNLAQAFNDYAPWNCIKPITPLVINEVRSELCADLKDMHTEIDKLQEQMKLIATFNNTWEEKLEACESCQRSIDDYTDNINAIQSAIEYVNTLSTIIGDIRYCDDYDDEEYVYVGIEVGVPTIDDIEK